MRFSSLSVGLLTLLTPFAAAWSKEDQEIFRVRDELVTHEGTDVTFYSFMGIEPAASFDDITKAYRKRTRSLHPDKVRQQLVAERTKADKKKAKSGGDSGSSGGAGGSRKGPSQGELKAAVKRASESQARLSLVANILKGPQRDRYDHFLAHGFPVWKGTGYYYNRYRPGLGSVLVGVFLFGGGAAHYIALYMSWRRQRDFVERYVRFARQTAWGENLDIPGLEAADTALPAPATTDPLEDDREEPAVPVPVNRKQRRMQEAEMRKQATKDGAAAGGRKGRRTAGNKGPVSKSAADAGAATPQGQAPAPAGPRGAKKKVIAENGKVLIVDSLGDVYLEEYDEDGRLQEFLLDPAEITKPRISDTLVVRLPQWILYKITGRSVAISDGEVEDLVDNDNQQQTLDEDDSSEAGSGKCTPGSESAEDFELLEKSTDSIGAAKSSGNQPASGSKAGKRKGKKR